MASLLKFEQWLKQNYHGMTEKGLKDVSCSVRKLIKNEYRLYRQKVIYNKGQRFTENTRKHFDEMFNSKVK
ncbi:MAG: hypothetical protein J6S67_25575 [Methanobrevibacter sp.]|nr:hypothetical protein [Methanobrevibacter sp.]